MSSKNVKIIFGYDPLDKDGAYITLKFIFEGSEFGTRCNPRIFDTALEGLLQAICVLVEYGKDGLLNEKEVDLSKQCTEWGEAQRKINEYIRDGIIVI